MQLACDSRPLLGRRGPGPLVALALGKLRALRYLVEALRPQAERVSEGPCATEQRGHEQEVPGRLVQNDRPVGGHADDQRGGRPRARWIGLATDGVEEDQRRRDERTRIGVALHAAQHENRPDREREHRQRSPAAPRNRSRAREQQHRVQRARRLGRLKPDLQLPQRDEQRREQSIAKGRPNAKQEGRHASNVPQASPSRIGRPADQRGRKHRPRGRPQDRRCARCEAGRLDGCWRHPTSEASRTDRTPRRIARFWSCSRPCSWRRLQTPRSNGTPARASRHTSSTAPSARSPASRRTPSSSPTRRRSRGRAVFYVRSVIARIGDGCGIDMLGHVEIVPPPGVTTAISAQHPVRCEWLDITTGALSPAGGCPRRPRRRSTARASISSRRRLDPHLSVATPTGRRS